MEIATVLLKTADIVVKLNSSPIVKEIKSIWKYETEVKMLGDTVEFIGDVLSDIEERQFQEASVIKGYKRLREAHLDAEDFLDRVETLKKKWGADDTKLKKTRRFFSKSNPAKYAVEVHNAIKEIRKNLDVIAQDLQKYGLKEPCIRSEATTLTTARAAGPFVDATEIIGRDEDKRKIIDLLLRSSVAPEKVPVISIVGMGGMGKTTLAQLVYDDNEWQESLKLWVSDSKKFNLKSLLKNILKSIISPIDISLDNLEEDHLKERLVNEIRGKSFFLVLDDVESEDPWNWEKLEALLNCGNKEKSRILVTTRSRKVTDVVGSFDSTYELKGLQEKDSLQLFERYAFRGKRDESLVEVGNHIVKNCLGSPLAIKVIGAYLKGKEKSKWERVRCHGLERDKNPVISILKTSYDDLDSTLKQCFSLCASFPKNHKVPREILSGIWMANVRLKTIQGETLEEVCNDRLKILCERFFLETPPSKDLHDCAFFIMHDLMHDLATEVAGEEILVVDSNAKVSQYEPILEKVRHFALNYYRMNDDEASTFEPKGRRLRTFLYTRPFYRYNGQKEILSVDKFVSNCRFLRVLGLHGLGIKKLTCSIGKMIHLRHLDLSDNEFQILPDSVIELINLRYLNLASCDALTRMPIGMDALTSLKVLDLEGCSKLEELAVGIVKLVSLRRLTLAHCGAFTRMVFGMDALTSLEEFDISWCKKLEQLPTGIEKLVSLRRLNCAWCKALTRMPFGMDALTSLEEFNISWCEKLEQLPTGIEKLVNLRRLKFAGCKALTQIPFGIEELTSLEEFDIFCCLKIKQLPTGIEKLVRLKKICLEECNALTQMPSGMGALMPVCIPPRFIIDHPESKSSTQWEELVLLSESNEGKLIIEFPSNITLKASEESEAILLNKKWLRDLKVKWHENQEEDPEIPRSQLSNLAKLQPPPNIEKLGIDGYQGMMFPPWMPRDGFTCVVPNLVGLKLYCCTNLRHLPPLSGLPCLRLLCLESLSSLEYIEENILLAASFCTSLEDLRLKNLPELKGWCSEVAEQPLMLPSFPHLNSLTIDSCPNLKVELLCSFVKVFGSTATSYVSFFVEVCRLGGKFDLVMKEENNEHSLKLFISHLFAAESSTSTIYIAEAFRGLSDRLTDLTMWECSGLKTIPGLQHLTALQKLTISRCYDFTGEEDDDDVELSWKGLKSLTKLTFFHLPKMVKLPQGIQLVTSLTDLTLCDLPKMEALPEWIQVLTSLQQAYIYTSLTVPEWVHNTTEYNKLFWTTGFSLVKKKT